MRLALLLLGWTLSSALAAPAQIPVKHVAFDLDWTLVEEVSDGRPVDPARTIQVEGKTYLIADGAEELITSLASDPRVRVSFFSGGSRARNVALLKKLRLSDGSGRSFLDIAEKVLSFDDLDPVVPSPGKDRPFSERYRKDLRKIWPDLEKAILVDDDIRFVSLDQRGSLIWLGKTYKSYATYADAQEAYRTATDRRYIPASFQQWLANKRKLARVRVRLKEALKRVPIEGLPCTKSLEKTLLQFPLHSR